LKRWLPARKFTAVYGLNPERGLVTTDGKHLKITLTPIPLETASSQVAHIDWIAFTFTPPENQHDKILHLLPQLASILDLQSIPAIATGGGWNGYTTRHNLTDGKEMMLGLIASGGDRQRGTLHVELNAQACSLVKDWQAFAVWGESIDARITRLDLAHDDLDGQTFTMQKMADWYQQGEFNSGGRKPSHRVAGDWLDPKSPDGRTLYIGVRANGKMLRIYEKGKELGDCVSPWVRVELELRGKNRIIPWDALIKAGNYLAGSFKCLNFLSLEQNKILTITKAVKISYEGSVEHARLMVGKLVNVMMQVDSGDAFAVVDKLKRDGVPTRLKNYAAHLPHVLEGSGHENAHD
jgi:DNA relaxase NicK